MRVNILNKFHGYYRMPCRAPTPRINQSQVNKKSVPVEAAEIDHIAASILNTIITQKEQTIHKNINK